MIETLKRVPLFRGLEDDDLKRIGEIAKRLELRADTTLFFEGDRADALYIVVSGSLKVHRTLDDGREKILGTMGPGEIFGELAMLDGLPRSASVDTVDPTELVAIARNDFRSLAMSRPDILWRLLEGLSERLRILNDAQLDVAFQDSPYRIAQAITRLAEKHGEPTKDGVRVRESFGVKALADMAATTPARVGRALEKLEDQGLVRLAKGDLVVPDLAALKRAIEYLGSE